MEFEEKEDGQDLDLFILRKLRIKFFKHLFRIETSRNEEDEMR